MVVATAWASSFSLSSNSRALGLAQNAGTV